jgi:hypothetical protein
MKRINLILANILIVVNLYFIPVTLINLKENGGPMGFGLLLVPFSFFINLLLIPAYYSFKKKYRSNTFLFVINFIGSIFSISLLWLLFTTPLID